MVNDVSQIDSIYTQPSPGSLSDIASSSSPPSWSRNVPPYFWLPGRSLRRWNVHCLHRSFLFMGNSRRERTVVDSETSEITVRGLHHERKWHLSFLLIYYFGYHCHFFPELISLVFFIDDTVAITVQKGYWFSSHEQWKYLELPYFEVEINRRYRFFRSLRSYFTFLSFESSFDSLWYRVFLNGEKVRTIHSKENNIPGIATSSPRCLSHTRNVCECCKLHHKRTSDAISFCVRYSFYFFSAGGTTLTLFHPLSIHLLIRPLISPSPPIPPFPLSLLLLPPLQEGVKWKVTELELPGIWIWLVWAECKVRAIDWVEIWILSHPKVPMARQRRVRSQAITSHQYWPGIRRLPPLLQW